MNKDMLWVGTSWKMNKTLAEAMAFAEGLAAADATRDPRVQRFVVPPFTAVRPVKEALASTSRQGRGAEHALGLMPVPGPVKYRR